MKHLLGLDSVEVLEAPPVDFNDEAAVGGEYRADQDFGIGKSELTTFTPIGEIILSETVGTNYRGLFWTRENPEVPIEGVQEIFVPFPEWTTSTFSTTSELIQHMFTTDAVYVQNQIYVGTAPHCTNVFFETGANLPDALCGNDANVANDDADLDIGFIGDRN